MSVPHSLVQSIQSAKRNSQISVSGSILGYCCQFLMHSAEYRTRPRRDLRGNDRIFPFAWSLKSTTSLSETVIRLYRVLACHHPTCVASSSQLPCNGHRSFVRPQTSAMRHGFGCGCMMSSSQAQAVFDYELHRRCSLILEAVVVLLSSSSRTSGA